MIKRNKRKFADLPPGADSPLNYAVSQGDSATMELVREAIEHRNTLLAFQPVMRASSPTKVAFYEGLVRVLDPAGRVIPAGQFMQTIEPTELGREIDTLALRLGLQALRAAPGLRLSINMSARSIGYSNWQRTLMRNIKRDPTLGERLILEITEDSAMLVPELVIGAMDDLQRHGVCFALDNYGAGYTAIRYFKDFLFDILKIDGQFVRGIAHEPDNRMITQALISIAEHFDMLTVAQSVEREEDAALLTQLGVDCLQGFYYAAPTVHPEWLPASKKEAG